jgi:hypothetical protein
MVCRLVWALLLSFWHFRFLLSQRVSLIRSSCFMWSLVIFCFSRWPYFDAALSCSSKSWRSALWVVAARALFSQLSSCWISYLLIDNWFSRHYYFCTKSFSYCVAITCTYSLYSIAIKILGARSLIFSYKSTNFMFWMESYFSNLAFYF